jgi:hypothetical protein
MRASSQPDELSDRSTLEYSVEQSLKQEGVMTGNALVVLGRGVLAGLVGGAGAGLAVATPIGLLSAASDPRLGLLCVYTGAWIGGITGLVVGVPSAVLLGLLSPLLRRGDHATVTGMAVAAAVGFLQVLIWGGAAWEGILFAGVCAIIGSMVGRWVVLGRRQKLDSRVEVEQWQ